MIVEEMNTDIYTLRQVTSRFMCHDQERGHGFFFQVLMGKDGIEDSLHAGSIREDAHGAGSSADLAEPAFDEIGGPDHLPERRLRHPEEAQQLLLVVQQALDGFGIERAPDAAERLQGGLGLAQC